MPPRAEDSGFTLVEVLVAFTIALVLLVPLLHSFSTGLQSGARTDAFTDATLIARSTLERLGTEVALNDKAGSKTESGPYRIETRIRRYRGEGTIGNSARAAIVPFDVAVTVSWRDGLRTRSVTLQGIRLGTQPVSEQPS